MLEPIWITRLSKLQDAVPQCPRGYIKSVIMDAMREQDGDEKKDALSFEAVFQDFDFKAIASASIAQARTHPCLQSNIV